MASRIEPGFFDRSQAVDGDWSYTSAEVPYFVFDADDEDAALEFAKEKIAASFQGMALDSVKLEERINETTFKVIASYKPQSFSYGSDGQIQEPEPLYTFDTGGGTQHLTQSIKTAGKFPSDAPDYGGAIGYDGENVNGVDIVQPVMNFAETHYFTQGKVTTTFKRKVAELTGKVNSDAFRGYDPGEVLFLGASGTLRGDKSTSLWEINYRFAVSPNRKQFNVGAISVSSKKGWDYMWVRYTDKPDNGKVLKKPSSVYVEQVYESGSLSSLGLGS